MELWERFLNRLVSNTSSSGAILFVVTFIGLFSLLPFIQSSWLPPFVGVMYGACLMFLGLVLINYSWNELRKCLRATATVIDIIKEKNTGADGSIYYLYTPTFQFINQKTAEQVAARYARFGSGVKTLYKIGQLVRVLYDPEEPTRDIRVDSFWHNQMYFLAMTGGEVFIWLVSLFLMF